MVNFPASVDTDTTLFLTKNLKTTTLSGAHNNSVTTITVASTSGFPTTGWLRIEEPTSGTIELVKYASTDATNFLTVTRGADADFPAQSHANGSTVTFAVVSDHHNVLKDAIIAQQTWAGVLGTQVHASITSASSPYTATSSDTVLPVDASTAVVTINLPTAAGIKGRAYYIVKTDSTGNIVTIDGSGSELVGVATTYLLVLPYSAVTLISDGTNWIVVGARSSSSYFDFIASRDTASFKAEGVVLFDVASTISGAIFDVGTTTTAAFAQGTFAQMVAGGTASTIALTSGTVVEYVAVVSTNKLPSANTGESGVCLTDTAPAAATFSTTTTTPNCVTVGFDSDAVWKILTCNGTTKTVTNTGITAATNTKYKVKIVWTVGTNVVVTIDNNAPVTVTATLPTKMTWHGASKAATNAVGDKLQVFGGAWRFG